MTRSRVLRALGIGLLALVGIALGIAAVIALGYLAFLFAKFIIVVSARAVWDGIKHSLSNKS